MGEVSDKPEPVSDFPRHPALNGTKPRRSAGFHSKHKPLQTILQGGEIYSGRATMISTDAACIADAIGSPGLESVIIVNLELHSPY